MFFAGQSGIVHYTVVLFVATGLLCLIVDGSLYKKSNMKKERKVARLLGWFHVIAGVFLFVGMFVAKWML